MCKVSVLMPVYNAEKYLHEAIDSIMAQSFKDWELIIVNDGSTDGSERIVESYSDSRIKYSKNERNRGIGYTRNKMIERAIGEYIAFLDSDDVSLSNRLAHQVSFLDNHSSYAMCGTWATMIDANGGYMKKIKMSTRSEDVKCALLFASCFVQSSVMIRRKILLEHPYREDLAVAEDYELWCRLSQIYKLQNIPILLTKYRWHGDNISSEKLELMNRTVKEIYKEQLEKVGISASEKELILHIGIKDKSIVDLPVNVYFKELKVWMKNLASIDCEQYGLDKSAWMATIAFRWIFACKEWGAMSKIFPIPISLNLKSLAILGRFLHERT